MGRNKRVQKKSKHAKVRQKDKDLKKVDKVKKVAKEPDDFIDPEGFVCLPESQQLPEEFEAELQAFRA